MEKGDKKYKRRGCLKIDANMRKYPPKTGNIKPDFFKDFLSRYLAK